jgi:hypothetical protein
MSTQKLYQRMMRVVRAGNAPRAQLDLTGSSAATPEAKKLLQRGSKSRVILHLLREKGRLTRQQIFEMTPRDLISSKNQVTKLLQILAEQKRIKVRQWTSKKKMKKKIDGSNLFFLGFCSQGLDRWKGSLLLQAHPCRRRLQLPRVVRQDRSGS